MATPAAHELRCGVRYVQGIARERRKVFEALMEAVKATRWEGQRYVRVGSTGGIFKLIF